MNDVINVTLDGLLCEVAHFLFAHLLFLDESKVDVFFSWVGRPFPVCRKFLSRVDINLEVVGIRFNGRE